MVNEDEFTKIFKYIIHGLGYKEKIFEELLMKKAINGNLYQDKSKRKTQPKNMQRVYRFKTENVISHSNNQSNAHKNTSVHNNTSHNKSRISSLHH